MKDKFSVVLSKIFNVLKNSFTNFYIYIKEFFLETLYIFKDLNKIVVWLIILIPVFFCTIINLFLVIFWYIFYMLIFLKKHYFKYFKKKNQKNLKVNKPVVIFKNYILIGLKNIFVEYPKRKGFLIMYMQCDLFFTFLNLNKNKNYFLYLENFFFNVFLFFFRTTIYLLIKIPFIVIKNNNYITKIIADILEMNTNKFENYISTIILNICVQTSQEIILKTYKLKIIFKKKKIIFNDKDFELLEKITDINLWVSGSKQLCKSGIIANMKYLGYNNKYLPYHPAIYFKNKNEYLVINQTTKKYLDIINNNENYNQHKTKKELDHVVKALYKKSDAYIVPPHVIDKKYTEIGDSTTLINILNNPINLIKKFNFVQSVLLSMEMVLFKFDPNNKILIDVSYLKVKTYILNNFNNFDNNTKKGLEDLIKFYEKNKNFFENERLPFITLLYKAEINENIRKYFLEIILK